MADQITSLRAMLEARGKTFDQALHGAIPADELTAIEAKLGVSIPSSYRLVLSEVGPFDDDGGLEVATPNLDPVGPDAMAWSLADAHGFAKGALERAAALEAGGTKLFTPLDAFDSVAEKRMFSSEMLEAVPATEHTGFLRVGGMSGVAGDLYVTVHGELRDAVWLAADNGIMPEFYVRDGEVVLHDVVSWLLSYARLI